MDSLAGKGKWLILAFSVFLAVAALILKRKSGKASTKA